MPNRPIEAVTINPVDAACKSSDTEWIHKPILKTRLARLRPQKTSFSLFQTLSVSSHLIFRWHLYAKILGYARIVLAVTSLYFMPIHPRTCSFLYSVSCLLDAIDGMLARKFNQSTQFGAVLDMTIDRCTSSCLLVFLAIAYPKWSIIFQGLISLDFSSHFMHVYATLAMGTANQSHKKINLNRPWAMRIYYSNTVCRRWIRLVG